MSLSDRDRKILLALIPIVVLVGYWFLVLAPKREEAASAAKQVAEQQQRLTAAQGTVSQASSAKNDFASDYTEVVRLGKAVPTDVDMPGLLVQLDRAASGTGIKFTKIGTGERATAAPATPPASDGSQPPASGGSQPPAAAGGQPAQSAPGSAAESANNAAATSDQRNQAAGGGTAPSDSTGAAPAGAAPAGLETVPLELEFQGNFFNLADFFHRVKRLVRVNNQNVTVSGRLVTIEGVKYSSDPELFPQLKAELTATIYLVPAAQGTSAGATPQGPSTTTPAAGAQPAPATPPTAAATP